MKIYSAKAVYVPETIDQKMDGEKARADQRADHPEDENERITYGKNEKLDQRLIVLFFHRSDKKIGRRNRHFI